MFDECIGLQMSIKIVKDFIHSIRTNSIQRALSTPSLDELNRSLYGTTATENQPYTPGLQDKQARAITQAKNAFQKKVTVSV